MKITEQHTTAKEIMTETIVLASAEENDDMACNEKGEDVALNEDDEDVAPIEEVNDATHNA